MISQYTHYRKLYQSEWRLWYIWKARIAKEQNYMDVEIHPYYQGEQGFINFVDDMGPRPSSKHELQRIDKWRGYEPGNLVWKERTVRITRRSQKPDAYDEYLQIARQNNIDYATFHSRVKRGWNIKDAATMPAVNLPYKSRLVQ